MGTLKAPFCFSQCAPFRYTHFILRGSGVWRTSDRLEIHVPISTTRLIPIDHNQRKKYHEAITTVRATNGCVPRRETQKQRCSPLDSLYSLITIQRRDRRTAGPCSITIHSTWSRLRPAQRGAVSDPREERRHRHRAREHPRSSARARSIEREGESMSSKRTHAAHRLGKRVH